ncbi:MAG TPA: hypothetical protein VIF57_02440 [Polyangia bacterium]
MLLLLTVAAGCYGTPRGTHSGKAGSGGAGGGGGQAGTSAGVDGHGGQSGASGGVGGSVGGESGTSGASGIGGAGAGLAFVGGPCVVTPDLTQVEVFGRASDGHIYRRVYDGANWGSWTNLPALDGTIIDARSDLDCSASGTSVHIVATGLNPVGAFLHAFGFGDTYNPFIRELATSAFAPSPSIADIDDSHYSLAGLAIGATYPVLFEIGDTPTPHELTPITAETGLLRYGPDIAIQPAGGSAVTYFASFDTDGALALEYHVTNSAGGHWADPVKLPAPVDTFTFSPAVCTESGGYGTTSINLVAVAGGQIWYARTSSITDPFSSWTSIAAAPASSPDCTVAGAAESIVHVVALSGTGTILDLNGKGTTWVVTDLGLPR